MLRPSFADLPLGKTDPPFSAWGLYGNDDELGTLNLLTPQVVAAAAKEIKTGMRIGLDLPLNYLDNPSHGRQGLTHKIISKAPRPVHDDTIELNTQVSRDRPAHGTHTSTDIEKIGSQWDGFRHYGYPGVNGANKFYNGATGEDISGSMSTTKLGIHGWSLRDLDTIISKS